MAFFKWQPGYSVQVSKFDEQHKQLINLINQLHEAMKAGQVASHLSTILSELDRYTKEHFSEEERMMQLHQYPGLALQKQAHAHFIQKIQQFKEQLNTGTVTTSIQIMGFLKDWLVRHILETDKKYAPFFLAKGIR